MVNAPGKHFSEITENLHEQPDWQELAALRRMKVSDLQAKYAEVFGESTTGRNKAWLQKRIAWRIQANAFGGLSDRAVQRAMSSPTNRIYGSTHPAIQSRSCWPPPRR